MLQGFAPVMNMGVCRALLGGFQKKCFRVILHMPACFLLSWCPTESSSGLAPTAMPGPSHHEPELDGFARMVGNGAGAPRSSLGRLVCVDVCTMKATYNIENPKNILVQTSLGVNDGSPRPEVDLNGFETQNQRF